MAAGSLLDPRASGGSIDASEMGVDAEIPRATKGRVGSRGALMPAGRSRDRRASSGILHAAH